MTAQRSAGARLAGWWVDALTHTADPRVAAARRAEIASDVHEQLSAATGQAARAAASRAVVGRVVRGMPADLAWRLRLEVSVDRLSWHLHHPSTAITAGFLVMLPVNLLADSAGTRSARLLDLRIPLWVVTDLLGVCILSFAVAAAGIRARRPSSDGQGFTRWGRSERLRRAVTLCLGVSWAGSAVFRYGAVSPLGAVFWAAFGISLLLYLTLLLATGAARLLDLRKISS